jgi:hypothetical protein
MAGAKKKNPAQISLLASAREEAPRKKHPGLAKAKPRSLRKKGWIVSGWDTSMSSLAGAAIGYDSTLKKFVGPEFVIQRWSREDHYFKRLKDAAKAPDLLHELLHRLGLMLNQDEIFIAQEEPWPVGMVGHNRHISGFLKQQAEISGAFLGGLVRYGYQNISQINSAHWRKVVADDLGITTHHTKWKDPALAARFNCKPQDTGKFRSKQWALDVMEQQFGELAFNAEEIPDWPDLITRPDGMVPRPEDSHAKAIQPDDRYDSLAIMWWHFQQLRQEGNLSEFPQI